jgi:hypothetical protein
MSNDRQGISLSVAASDFFHRRQDALLKHNYAFLTRDGCAPGVLSPPSGNLWEVRSNLFEAHARDGATIMLLETIITLNGQAQLTGDDLSSLARSQQRAAVERANIVSVS